MHASVECGRPVASGRSKSSRARWCKWRGEVSKTGTQRRSDCSVAQLEGSRRGFSWGRSFPCLLVLMTCLSLDLGACNRFCNGLAFIWTRETWAALRYLNYWCSPFFIENNHAYVDAERSNPSHASCCILLADVHCKALVSLAAWSATTMAAKCMACRTLTALFSADRRTSVGCLDFWRMTTEAITNLDSASLCTPVW